MHHNSCRFHNAECTYLVENVESKTDAVQVAGHPDHSKLINVRFSDTADESNGIPFDKAEQQGLNVDRLREEYNMDAGNKYIEELIGIKDINNTSDEAPTINAVRNALFQNPLFPELFMKNLNEYGTITSHNSSDRRLLMIEYKPANNTGSDENRTTTKLIYEPNLSFILVGSNNNDTNEHSERTFDLKTTDLHVAVHLALEDFLHRMDNAAK